MGRINETYLTMTLMTGTPHGLPMANGLPLCLRGVRAMKSTRSTPMVATQKTSPTIALLTMVPPGPRTVGAWSFILGGAGTWKST